MNLLTSRNIGIITGLLMVAVSLLMVKVMGLSPLGSNQYAIWSIYIAGIVTGLLIFKSRNPQGSFKTYFSEGFKTFIVAALIIVVYTFIFYKLNPQYMEAAIIENNALALKEGNHTPHEIEENANGFRKIFVVGMVMTNTIIYLLIGALMSVIGAGFLSQKRS